MDFIKSRWSGSNQNTQATPPEPIESSYNSVKFNNGHSTSQNPIIISSQHPTQISIIHEVRNPQMKTRVMTSPTDSFHSVASTFRNDKREGKTNLAFNNESNVGMSHNINNQHQPTYSSSNPPDHVFHQSYWSWNWPWSTWNQREKILLLVVVILSLCILSLSSALSVILQKNIEYRSLRERSQISIPENRLS